MHRFGAAFRQDVEANLARFDRHSIELSDGLRKAAVAVTLVGTEDDAAAFVLTRRPLDLRRHAGQWAIPGGRVDPGESDDEAARRELKEETGLDVGNNSVLGRLDDYRTRSGFIITPVVLWGPDRPELKPDPREVAAAYVVPLEALDAPGLPRLTESETSEHPLISFPLESLKTTIYAPTAALLYQMREVVVHGRTARVAHYEQPRFAWR